MPTPSRDSRLFPATSSTSSPNLRGKQREPRTTGMYILPEMKRLAGPLCDSVLFEQRCFQTAEAGLVPAGTGRARITNSLLERERTSSPSRQQQEPETATSFKANMVLHHVLRMIGHAHAWKHSVSTAPEPAARGLVWLVYTAGNLFLIRKKGARSRACRATAWALAERRPGRYWLGHSARQASG